jgi:hypothetical protein
MYIIAYDFIFSNSWENIEFRKFEIESLIATFSEGYVWQKDWFKLYSSSFCSPPWNFYSLRSSIKQPVYLWGSLEVEENNDDICFVLFLILEVTKKIPDVTARIWSIDGQVLLTEFLYLLPKRMLQGHIKYRVFFSGGKVYFFSPRLKDLSIVSSNTIMDSLSLLSNEKGDDLINSKIQACIENHIIDFPQKASDSLCSVKCIAFSDLYDFVKHAPTILLHAWHIFCSRENLSFTLNNFSRLTNHEKLMTFNVIMNRLQYLQFVQNEPSISQDFEFYQGVRLDPIASNIGLKLTISLSYAKKLKLQLQTKQQALIYPRASCYESSRVYINCLERLGLTFGKTSSIKNAFLFKKSILQHK